MRAAWGLVWTVWGGLAGCAASDVDETRPGYDPGTGGSGRAGSSGTAASGGSSGTSSASGGSGGTSIASGGSVGASTGGSGSGGSSGASAGGTGSLGTGGIGTGGSAGGGNAGTGGGSAGAPDEPGAFGFEKYTVTFAGRHFCNEVPASWPEPGACWGTYDADIYYPAANGSPDASAAPYPGVIASSGHLGNKAAISWVAEHLVSHGYVVLAFTQPYPSEWTTTQLSAGHRTGIDVVLEENARFGSKIHALVDVNRFGIIGHSEGGGGAVGAAGTDARVDAAVGLAAWRGMAGDPVFDRAAQVKNPILFVTGSADAINTKGSHDLYDTVTLASKYFSTLGGAGHMAFATGLGGANGEEYKRLSKKYFTTLYDWTLKGGTPLGAYLATEGALDQSAGALTTVEWQGP